MSSSMVSLTPTSPPLPSVIQDLAALNMECTSKSESEKGSRLLNLTPEIRINIWKFALPCGQKLILDKDNIEVPGPVQKGDYAATASLLHLCKQTYAEVLPLIYSENTVAVLAPWEENQEKGLECLPVAALQQIKKVELRLVDGLADMGESGAMILAGRLPKLEHVQLNFWHARLWLRPAMELAYRSQYQNFEFKLQLFESVHNMHYLEPLDEDIIKMDIDNARRMAKIYDLKMPATLKNITLSASVEKETAYELATFQHELVDFCFNKDGNKDTKAVKHLVCQAPASSYNQIMS